MLRPRGLTQIEGGLTQIKESAAPIQIKSGGSSVAVDAATPFELESRIVRLH